MQSDLRREGQGAFRVLSCKGSLSLLYCFDSNIVEEPIELNQDTARLSRDVASFFSLSALIAAHYCDQGQLECTLKRDPRHVLTRSLHRTGAGTVATDALARVDKKAKASKYFLGGVPEESAMKVRQWTVSMHLISR